MRPLSASQLVNLWERGPGQHPAQRALALLEAAHPEDSPQELALLPIGRCNALLLTLREWTFGSRVSGVVTCPNCGQRLETDFSISEIRAAEAGPRYSRFEVGECLSLETEGYEVQFRLPNGLDLMAVSGYSDPEAARRALLEGCVLSVLRDGEVLPVDALPEQVTARIAESMEQADPQADVELSLSCPTCGRQWQAAFDIASYFLSEISDWAPRILRDVHALASAYGWRESDILALSPWRRQLYLDMIYA
jgi:uncharacterized protein (UPF0212 family)